VRLVLICCVLVSFARAADYAGNEACASCHAAIYQKFMRTPMAGSSGRVGSGDLQERFDKSRFSDSRGMFDYRAGKDQNGYNFEFQQRGGNTQHRSLDFFVGSGAAARSYLMSAGGFLYESPVAYYSGPASWSFAPGYANYSYPFLTRPVLPGCLQCHASGVRRVAGTQNAYASPPFSENGVACERCHGLGGDHIAKGTPMVDPSKLAPQERDSVCEQCHLSGEIRVPKAGKEDEEFRPGSRLSDYLTVFVSSSSAPRLRVTSHAENLAQSMCKAASGSKMWCGTCHDPHTVPAAAEKPAYFRSKCLGCHQPTSCKASQLLRASKADNCVECHMPRNPVNDADHVVFTDHSIRRHPTSVAAAQISDASLEKFGGGAAGARDLGLAYAMVALREQNGAYRQRAFELLQQAVANGDRDVPALAYLAEFYRDRGNDAQALPLYEEVWQRDKTQSAASAALGAYQMQRGHIKDAVDLWQRTLAISPGLVLVRVNLATALVRLGRKDEAKVVLQKALEFNPSFREAQDLLNQLTR
jgi:predicted CXXCH cytochrome family protein